MGNRVGAAPRTNRPGLRSRLSNGMPLRQNEEAAGRFGGLDLHAERVNFGTIESCANRISDDCESSLGATMMHVAWVKPWFAVVGSVRS